MAQLCRMVSLKALCVVAAAYTLGPSYQDAHSMDSLLQLLQLLVSGGLGFGARTAPQAKGSYAQAKNNAWVSYMQL